jgi:glycosyltransferase involved in cell wall biosynthesis
MTRSILLISFYAPGRGHAGGLRLLDLYSELRKLRPDLYLALMTFEQHIEDWGDELVENIFDEVHRLPLEKFGIDSLSKITFEHAEFDFIDLQYHQCGALVDVCRRRWPKATIAFSPMESMFRIFKSMISAGFETFFRLPKMATKLWLACQEIGYVRSADRVITVSAPDRDGLAWFKSKSRVFCVPTGLSAIEFPMGDFKRFSKLEAVVVFFAFFGSRTNCESLLWYCREVHPRLREQVAGYRLRVVGRGLSQELMERCACSGVEFVGQVDFIQDGLRGAVVGIAPALGGAGVRGKIHHYSAMGIPCVASPLACEGLDYRDGESIFVAGNATAFAAACVKLLNSVALRDQIGSRARQVCLDQYTWASMERQIVSAYKI